MAHSALLIVRMVMIVTASAPHHSAHAAAMHVDVIQVGTSLTAPRVGTRLLTRAALVHRRVVDERASRAHPLRQIAFV